MERWWIDTDRGQLSYWWRNLFHCLFLKVVFSGIEPGDPR